jgi:predicted transcriptional regulator
MNEIFASILSSVTENGELGFTKIMYNCYLSYGQVTRFLQFANENDFLVYDNNTELFKITDKGYNFENYMARWIICTRNDKLALLVH